MTKPHFLASRFENCQACDFQKEVLIDLTPNPNTVMKTLIQAIKTFWNDDDGMEMIEYALFGALIVVAAATAFTSFGTTIGLQIKK